MEKASDIKEQVTQIISFCLKKDNTKMRSENMDDYKQLCMRTFTNFHQNYPTLFFSIVERPSSFPLFRLDEMLKIKEKIEENVIEEKDASVYLGQKYYNEFVKDTVKNLDKEFNL
jgi:hypothetical protein